MSCLVLHSPNTGGTNYCCLGCKKAAEMVRLEFVSKNAFAGSVVGLTTNVDRPVFWRLSKASIRLAAAQFSHLVAARHAD